MPAISSTSFCGVVVAASCVPWNRPSRRTVTRWATRITSESRWVTKRTALPARGDAAHELEHDVDTTRVECRGRLVEDQHLGLGGDRADDLDQLTVAGR